jgi:YHS domain-containing protein
MIRFLQFLAFILLFRYIWRGVQRMLGEVETRRVSNDTSRDRGMVYRGQMVRDPVCGVYIPEQGALIERRGDETYYFCSEACRSSFLAQKAQAS